MSSARDRHCDADHTHRHRHFLPPPPPGLPPFSNRTPEVRASCRSCRLVLLLVATPCGLPLYTNNTLRCRCSPCPSSAPRTVVSSHHLKCPLLLVPSLWQSTESSDMAARRGALLSPLLAGHDSTLPGPPLLRCSLWRRPAAAAPDPQSRSKLEQGILHPCT